MWQLNEDIFPIYEMKFPSDIDEWINILKLAQGINHIQPPNLGGACYQETAVGSLLSSDNVNELVCQNYIHRLRNEAFVANVTYILWLFYNIWGPIHYKTLPYQYRDSHYKDEMPRDHLTFLH